MWSIAPEHLLFWAMSLAILAAPFVLLAAGAWHHPPEARPAPGPGLLLARCLGLLAASLPLLQILLFTLPSPGLGLTLLPFFWELRWFSIALAIVGSGLFLLYAKGTERAAGPVALMFAAGLLLFLRALAGGIAI